MALVPHGRIFKVKPAGLRTNACRSDFGISWIGLLGTSAELLHKPQLLEVAANYGHRVQPQPILHHLAIYSPEVHVVG